jgi:hypothetical protein
MAQAQTPSPPSSGTAATPVHEVPFGANEMRLNARQWLATAGLVLAVTLLTPRLWPHIERLALTADYRLPYELSNDYWLYDRRLRQASEPRTIPVLGDSVVWGEYVRPDGTLSHFLNRATGEPGRFVNAGVNGCFPLALEGLIRYYGQALRHQKVILQYNPLWMTSPKADLSTDKEEAFNHPSLVPQVSPRIPCYKASAEERLSVIMGRQSDSMAWVAHLQNACFGQQSIPKWTLAEDGSDPPRRPNAYKNPLSQITFRLPSAPADDPQRGPQSPRHKPWSENARGTTEFDWVRLDASLQWQGFQRLVELLRQRGNDVLVVLGPFNEHLLAESNRPTCRELTRGIALWMQENRVPYVQPEILPSALYADASHPLTEGYELLANRIAEHPGFREWLRR